MLEFGVKLVVLFRTPTQQSGGPGRDGPCVWGGRGGCTVESARGPFQCPRPRPHLQPVALQGGCGKALGCWDSSGEPHVQTSLGTTALGPTARPASQTLPSEATVNLCPDRNPLPKASPPAGPSCAVPLAGVASEPGSQTRSTRGGGHAPPVLGVDVLKGQGALIWGHECTYGCLSPQSAISPDVSKPQMKGLKCGTKGPAPVHRTLPFLVQG